MANYQWVGATASTISKYSWNVPSNWRERYWNPVGYWDLRIPSVCPGPFDVAGIGSVFSASLTCYSPLLYGGYTGSVGSGGWAGSSLPSGGHTFNTPIASVKVQVGSGTSGNFAYPFPYLGGGITGPGYDWVVSTEITEGGMSGTSFSIADVGTQSLNLKVQNFEGNTEPSNLVSSFKFVKNLSKVDGTTSSSFGGAGTSGAPIVKNTLSFVHAGSLIVRGGHWENMSVYPNYTVSGITGNPKTTVSESMCRTINTKTHTFLFDSDVTAGKVHVQGGNFYLNHLMRFLGSIDMENILVEFYPGSGAALTGDLATTESSLLLDNVSSFGVRYPVCPFVFGDYQGKGTSKAGSIIVQSSTEQGTPPIYNIPWMLEFAGDTKVNVLRSKNSTISASSLIDPYAKVEIGTVYLDDGSFLDFGAYPNFDGWFIGSPTGSAGGIIFQDDISTVGGSEGLRLWSSQMVLGGRVDSRLSTQTKNPSKFILPNAPTSIDY